MNSSRLGFGVVGSLPPDTVAEIAVAADRLGFATLWFNETPDGDALERVALAQSLTRNLVLGVGVINLDAKTPGGILAAVEQRNVDPARLILGVGASRKPSPLTTVGEGIRALKDGLSSPIAVGSLGPKMRQLGAEQGDGLLFNWLPPKFAAETTETLRQQASAAGRERSIAATYVRTALGADALPVLEREAAKYSAIPSYAANFERLGITAMESAVYGNDAAALMSGLQAFDGTVDDVVVRAITPTDDARHYLELLEAVAPLATNGATSGV